MKLISRLVLAILVCFLGLGLVSCGENDGGTDESNKKDTEVIYSPYVDTALVLGEGVEKEDVQPIRNAYYNRVGKAIPISSGAESSEREIIVGKNESPLSKEAYSYLASLKKESGYAGYVIYSDGKSVAIAFDDAVYGEDIALYEAVDLFAEKHMQKDTLKLSSGLVDEILFDAIAKQSERDKIEEDRLWELKLGQLTEKTGSSDDASRLVEALLTLRKAFGGSDIALWLSGLYDSERGGFYYSASAKGTDTYLPDLESTYHALGIIEYILTDQDRDVKAFLGDEISEKIIAFVKSMQDKDNGYFYHPQWKKEDIDNNKQRRERDLLDAVNILKMFGEAPLYDAEGGIKGSTGAAPASCLTLPLKTGREDAVRHINAFEKAGGEYYIPPYLRSATEFSKYLADLSITDDTAAACKTILAEIPLYKSVEAIAAANGEKIYIIDTLVNTLSRNQLSNGLWTKGDDLYFGIERLVDVAKIYSALEIPMPKAGNMFNTLIKALNFDKEVKDLSLIANTWLSLSSVVDNLITYTADEGEKETLSWRIPELYISLTEPLSLTAEKLSEFACADGGFASSLDNGASVSFGMPVSVPGTRESDIKGTYYAVKVLWLSVFNMFDIGNVPVIGASDRMLLQKTLVSD